MLYICINKIYTYTEKLFGPETIDIYFLLAHFTYKTLMCNKQCSS